jgi:hypothetical protein
MYQYKHCHGLLCKIGIYFAKQPLARIIVQSRLSEQKLFNFTEDLIKG